MTSAEDARFSALRFHPASEWMNSAAEEFPPRFIACDVIFEKFQKEPLQLEGAKTFVRVKRFFSAKVNPPRRWPIFWCDRRLRFAQLDAGRRSGNSTASFLV